MRAIRNHVAVIEHERATDDGCGPVTNHHSAARAIRDHSFARVAIGDVMADACDGQTAADLYARSARYPAATLGTRADRCEGIERAFALENWKCRKSQ
jgi:hypothetical protein